MRIGILGSLQIDSDGRRVELSGGRLRVLLARMAIAPGRPVAPAGLADAVWDGALPRDEAHALQSLVSRLRRALGDPQLIVGEAAGYRLAVEPEAVDSVRFERLAADGAAALRSGDAPGARDRLAEALSLWRGPALAELAAGPALAAEAARLEDLRLQTLLDRAEADVRLGRAAEAAAELAGLAGEHPLHERLAAQLVRALSAAGRQADALATYERVRARLADELGTVPSQDLQAAHLEVLRGDPAPRAPAPERSGRRTNLPARLTSFVGREQELERIGALFGEHRLVTLVGPGGAGKTRLAGEVAGGVIDAYADGVWLVELAPVADGAGLAPALLGSLGLREAQLLAPSAKAPVHAVEHAIEILEDKRTLILLDNCEHLIAPAAELAQRLLAACPALRILATSREPLGILGETIVPVTPLELPTADTAVEAAVTMAAVRLFADRARAAADGFALTEATLADVAEICRRVDGLPLAIELAAARLRSMTLPQLAARLDDRFRVLTGGNRTAVARQRTLRAVVDWSWDLLDEPERHVLRRLAVFSGGATLGAAEAVCAGPGVTAGEVFDLLCALVDKSLLQVVEDSSGAGGPRYRMLETIREYGLERADEAGDLAAARDAHADHFAALVAEAEPHLRSAAQLTWLARLSADHDNVLSAVRYLGESGRADAATRTVVGLLWFWLLGGSRQEAITWVDFCCALSGRTDPLDGVMIESAHAIIHAVTDDAQPADPWQGLAEALARLEGADLSDRPLLAAIKPVLAFALGRERVAELLEDSDRHPDPWVRATVPFVRVQITENEGDIEGMRIALDASLQAFGAVGDRWGLGATLSELAGLRTLDGDLDGAESALLRARSLMAELGAQDDSAMLQLRLADVRARRGDLAGARDQLERDLAGASLFTEERVMVNVTRADLCRRLGQLDEARRLSAEALADLDQSRHVEPRQGHPRAMALAIAAVIALAGDDLAGAQERAASAYVAALGTSDMPLVATVGLALADLAVARGRPADAAAVLGAAAALRGTEDPTNPDVVRLTERLSAELGDAAFAELYGAGRELDRAAALARLDPAALDGSLHVTAVGAEGQGHEDREQSPHPDQGPEHV